MDEILEIVRRVLGGDADAFRAIVERYQGPIWRVTAALVGDRHLAEDVAQETFLEAYRKLRTFDPAIGRLSTWLFAIARNKAIDAHRKKRASPVERLPDRATVAGADADLAREEWMEALDRALGDLPDPMRAAFVLAEIEGLSYEEIARIEGARLGTVRSRIHRAKERLRAALRRFEEGEDATRKR